MSIRKFESIEKTCVVPRNISSRFSSNSKADASELLENLEEVFLCVGKFLAFSLTCDLQRNG